MSDGQGRGPVVVVGEALVDDYGDRAVVGGAPFNVARSLAAFGVPVRMLTRIGDDAAGAAVRADFARFGLGTEGLQVDRVRPTGRVLVERRGADHVFRILDDQAWDHLDAAAACAAVAGLRPHALYLGTLAQRGPVSRAAIVALRAAVAAPVVVDLNLRADQVVPATVAATLRGVQALKVNEEELRRLVGWFVHPAQAAAPWGEAGLGAAAEQLLAQFGVGELFVTRGADGAAWLAPGGRCTEQGPGAPPPRWGDSVGAGDAFAAVVLAGRWHGWDPRTVLARANDFAAAVCGLDGAVPADLGFYARWRQDWGLA